MLFSSARWIPEGKAFYFLTVRPRCVPAALMTTIYLTVVSIASDMPTAKEHMQYLTHLPAQCMLGVVLVPGSCLMM